MSFRGFFHQLLTRNLQLKASHLIIVADSSEDKQGENSERQGKIGEKNEFKKTKSNSEILERIK